MTVYELSCKKCGYTLRFRKGVLMSFHNTNRELLKKMRNGELGEKFGQAANEHPEAVADHSHELYRCVECGELYGRMAIELRGAGNTKLVELEQLCERCGSNLEMIDGDRSSRKYELSCPCCKEKINRATDQTLIMLAD